MTLHAPTGPHFSARELPAQDIAAYVTKSVRSAPQKYETSVTVHAPAHVIAERVPHGIVIEPIDDDSCMVDAGSNTIEMLALYLGMLDADFTGTGPPELKERMQLLAQRFARAAQGNGR